MQRAKLCIVLLAFGLGWHGLPDRGFAQDYTQSTNFGVLNPGDHVNFKVTPPKNGKGQDAIVTSGRVDDPGGFTWIGSLANWSGTVPPDFAAQHIGLFSGEYGYPGTNGGRALTWKMDTMAVVIKVKMDHDLWWFGGKDAANYDESATLTANGTTVGTFNWQVVQGGNRIVLNNGGDDSWNITATDDNTIVVKSTGRSVSPFDTTIRFSFNGVFVCDYNLSVYSPMTVQRMSGPVDDTYEIIGFQTEYTFRVLDNFGNLLPREIEVNEEFGPWTSDWTIANGRPTDENWPEPTPNGHFTGSKTPIHFTETYAYATFLRTPGTVNPGTTHAEESVQHALQTYQAGSLTHGEGVMIKSHTEQLYRGQGRQ